LSTEVWDLCSQGIDVTDSMMPEGVEHDRLGIAEKGATK